MQSSLGNGFRMGGRSASKINRRAQSPLPIFRLRYSLVNPLIISLFQRCYLQIANMGGTWMYLLVGGASFLERTIFLTHLRV